MKNKFSFIYSRLSVFVFFTITITISTLFTLYPLFAQATDFGSVASGVNSENPPEITTITIPAPLSISSGDFLIAGIAFNGGDKTSVIAPTGWTLIERKDGSGTNDNNIGLVTYYRIANSSEPSSYSWNLTNLEGESDDEDTEPRAAGGIIRYTGVNIDDPIDVKAKSEGNGNMLYAPSITTTNANETVILFYAQDDSTDHPTPSGTTERYDIANPDNHVNHGPEISAADFIKNISGSTEIKSIDVGNQEDWVTQTIALKNTIPTTGKITITKTAIGGNGTFDFTGVGTGITPGTSIIPSFSIDTTVSNTTTLNNLEPGEYTITEIAETGWDTTLNTCTVTITIGNVQTCNFTNTFITQQNTNNGGGGNTGGGSGGGAPAAPTLIIIDGSIQVTNVTETEMTIAWQTNLPASSYVIYSNQDGAPQMNLSDTSGNPPKYGYSNATSEIDTNPKVTNHSVTVTGLSNNNTYYFRVVSRGSLAFSNEYKITLGTTTQQPVIVENNNAPVVVTLPPVPSSTSGNAGGNISNQSGQTQGAGEIPTPITGDTTTEGQINTQGGEINLNQPAAISETGVVRQIMDWISANFWWLLLLLLILVALAYYYWQKQKEKIKK